MGGSSLIYERIGKNDAAFRQANEGISATAQDYELGGLLPFICECADPSCTSITRLTPEEYEAVRSEPTHFLNAPGHQADLQGAGSILWQNERYVVVAKEGRAGEVAEELDPRADGHVSTDDAIGKLAEL